MGAGMKLRGRWLRESNMPKSLDNLRADRRVLMKRLVLEFVVEQDVDVAEGPAPELHRDFSEEAELPK
jgi:hypothetical protein